MKIHEKIEYIVLTLILIAAFYVRTYKINNPIADWHSWRQTGTASVAYIFSRDGIDLLHPRYFDISTAQTGYENPEGYWYVEMPLVGALHATLAQSFPHQDFVVLGRLISILASLVSVVCLFVLGKKFISSIGGIAAAAFFALLPFSIFYSRVLLPEPVAVAAGLVSLVLFVHYKERRHTLVLLVSAVSFAISVLVKPFTIFYAVVLAYVWWTDEKRDLKAPFVFALSLLPFVGWRMWIAQYPEGIPHTKWAFNGDGIRFRPAFWRWLFGERLGKLILGTWGLIPFGLGILSASKKTKGFILAFLLSSFLFISTFATANVRHDYYQIVVIPSVCLALAAGAVALWDGKLFKKFTSKVLLAFSVFMMLGMSWYEVRGFYNVNHAEIIAAGEKVQELTSEDAKVIAPYNKDMAFLYQTKRYGWPFVDGSIESMKEKGATHYVSVNYDPLTLELMDQYEVLAQTHSYVILDLGKEIQ